MQLTPALSFWIAQQLAQGCEPADLIEAMIAIGHEPTPAREWIIAASRQHGAGGLAPSGDHGSTGARVPEPFNASLASMSPRITTADRKVPVLVQLRHPRILVLEGVLSCDECDALIREATPKLERSRTVDRSSGGTELNDARTSEGTYFLHDESELLITINRRIAALTHWPLENGEPLQILHYETGAQYEPHYDFFDPADAGTPKLIEQGGQRVATLIIYLNSVEVGGATVFPEVGLEVAPITGNAVYFSYNRPHADTLTLHAGTPVVQGEKWIATRWMRQHAYPAQGRTSPIPSI